MRLLEGVRRARAFLSHQYERGRIEGMTTNSPATYGDYPFIQARHFTPGRRSPIELVVVHDMEAARSMLTALHVSQWFASAAAPQASTHRCTDRGSTYQCVRDEDTAWGAPGANDNGLHLELAGFWKDSVETWLSDGDELLHAADVVADWCFRWEIPTLFLDATALAPYVQLDPVRKLYFVRGIKGITTHVEITKATHLVGGHVDPGPHFPMDRFIDMVNGASI